MSKAVEAVGNLVGVGPSGGPLGGFKPYGKAITDIGAVAAAPFTGGLSLAIPLARGAYDISQGNTLGGALELGSAGLGGLGVLGAPAAGAGSAAAGVPGGAGVGSSLSDFAASEAGAAGLPAGAFDAGIAAAPAAAGAASGAAAAAPSFFSDPIGSISSTLGQTQSNIGSGFDKVLNSLGIGGSAPAAGDAVASGVSASQLAPPGFTDLSPADISELNAANPAGQAAINAITGGPGAASSGGGILSDVSAFTKAHPILTQLGLLTGGQVASPVLSKLTGGSQTAQEKALLQNAQATQGQAQGLISSLTSGTLPPGAQQSVQQALDADISQIKQRYASMGMSGSAAEQTDIANAQNLAASNKFQLAQTATTTGLNELGLTDNIYASLVQNQLTRQGQLSDALSRYIAALGTGTALAQAKAA